MYTRFAALGAVFALNAITVLAKPTSYCANTDPKVCFQWAIPEASASSGSGDIFFQLSAPTSLQWTGLGIGTGMAGADIFVIYQDGNGNVTLSTRSGKGHVMPQHVERANVELLAGSGVQDDMMIANVRCGDCKKLDLSGQTNWISAWKAGKSLDSASPSARLDFHGDDNSAVFQVDLSKAAITGNTNPFVAASGDSTTPPSGSDSSDGDSGAVTAGSKGGSNNEMRVLAHGVIMTLVFVALYPLGAILMPVIGKWFIHAGWQMVAFILMWAGFAIGYMLARDDGIFFQQTHTKMGTIVVALLGIQPILGWLHHSQFAKTGSRGVFSYVHVWYGRILMLVGIVNGGLGLKLANASNSFIIAYSVIAAVIGVMYIAAAALGLLRRDRQTKNVGSPPETRQAKWR